MNIENKKVVEKPEDSLKAAGHRFLARIIIEAETPLSVKSGDGDVYTDAVVMTDVNGLPFIPGSSIAGVVRHAYRDLCKCGEGEEDKAIRENELFGFQGKEFGSGSLVIFSEARILDSKGVVMDGMLDMDTIYDDNILTLYRDLPIRQHVRINHYGTAEDGGKFDEQVVFAGTRFCFEIEMLASEESESDFERLLAILGSETFRIGGGSRKGFGKIKVKSVQYSSMPVADERYLSKSSNLQDSDEWFKKNGDIIPVPELPSGADNPEWIVYHLELKPDSFFLFGSGFGDDDADMTPVTETRINWDDHSSATPEEHSYLVPAASIKGTLAHRVAYHFNRLSGVFADDFVGNEGKNAKGESMSDYVGANNTAVRILFGSEGDAKGNNKLRGNVLISDLYKSGLKEKVLNHVAIDRFTGGAIDGALFSEKVVYGAGSTFGLDIYVDEKRVEKLSAKESVSAAGDTDNHSAKEMIIKLSAKESVSAAGDTDNHSAKEMIMIAFESALSDICNGLLPLGGGVNRGNGIFKETTENQTKPWKRYMK